MQAVPDSCCGNGLSVGEPLALAWLPWIITEAERRGIALSGVRWTGDHWAPAQVMEMVILPISSGSVVQRLGCRGVRTRVEVGEEGRALGGIFCEIDAEPKWRVLLLEALVLADSASNDLGLAAK